jgi:hypothetical protein
MALAKQLGENHEQRERLMWRMCNCTPAGIESKTPNRSHPVSCNSPACIWCAHRKARDVAVQLLHTVELARRLALELRLVYITKTVPLALLDPAIFKSSPSSADAKFRKQGAVGCRSFWRLAPAPKGFVRTGHYFLFFPWTVDAAGIANGRPMRAADIADDDAVRKLLIHGLAYPTQFMSGDINSTATICRAMSKYRPRWSKTTGLIKASDELFKAVRRLPKPRDEGASADEEGSLPESEPS